ncbi:MAG: flagellar biosynthetic protein FliQ [Phycisphaerae bacterium]
MEMTEALDLGREALLKTLIIAGPVLGVGLLVGLIISLVQTITQIHDQTFALIPKIIAMIAAAVFFIPWVASRLVEYTQAMFAG